MLGFLGIFEMDRDILLYVQEHWRVGFLNEFFKAVTHLGDAGIFWIILTCILLCFKKTRKAGLFSAGALAGSVLLNNCCLKVLINRTRPSELIPEIDLLIKEGWEKISRKLSIPTHLDPAKPRAGLKSWKAMMMP